MLKVAVRCKICSESFTNNPVMLEHFLDEHLSKLAIIPCLFCNEKEYANFEDLMHHIILDHKGIDKSQLQNATLARLTKKQLGDYLDIKKKEVGMECPECFEIFSNIDKLDVHAKTEHDREIRPEFLAKMRKKIENTDAPVCEMCNRKFVGVVFTKINEKITNVCFNCYEDYFGANALRRLTIGTNEDMIKKMREPL